MLRSEKLIDRWHRFKLAYNARQWGPVVVYLRFFHAPLPILIAEETEHLVEGLLWIVHNIGKGSTLTVFEEPLPCEGHFRHFGGSATRGRHGLKAQYLDMQNMELQEVYLQFHRTARVV
jgi:hypothetical protein